VRDEMIETRACQRFDERWLTVAGLRIHCLVAGRTGPPVLLLHGSGLDAAGISLARAMHSLATNCRVYAPDLPGFGDSDPMPDRWGFSKCSAFLSPLLAALDLERASLVGLSMGGGIALGFALMAPERVDRLVLIDSACLSDAIPGGRRTWFAVHMPGWSTLQWRVLAASRHLTRWLLRRATRHNPEEVTSERLDRVMRHLRRPGAAAAFRKWERREVGWRGLRTSYVDRLPALSVATLILHGANDPLLPVAVAERAHRLIPFSRLEVIPDCGHLAPLDQPEAVSRALRAFLQPIDRAPILRKKS
jgi:pimeloyl-ACP methyl ester carboxylesterase